MDLLKQKILADAVIIDGKIVKVDSFINHQIDVELLNEMGTFLAEKFSHVSKILTIETSGIAYAIAVSQHLGNVPVVFAKKQKSAITSSDTYTASIYSYTKDVTYECSVDKRFLSETDHVLIIDDFLAEGNAVLGLINMCQQARASVEGVGIIIEKGFQPGRSRIEALGIRVESCAIIEKVVNDSLTFKS